MLRTLLRRFVVPLTVSAAGLWASGSPAGENPYPPAPGHAGLPTVFWSHYMPQVGTLQLAQNEHAQGGTDNYPFISLDGTSVDVYARNIREALDAGINGFQMLTFAPPEMYEAARRVKEQTGELFYVAPQWCGLGDDPKVAQERIAAFARDHRDDPHVFRHRGKQVHFLYNQGKWSGDDWSDSRNIAGVQDYLRKQGLEVMLLPCTAYGSDKIMLDRAELKHQPWKPFAPVTPGELNYLKTTAWDGIGSWTADVPQHINELLMERLRPLADRFLYIPAVWPGYDSSNRYFQAIHTPNRGVAVLRNGLRSCLENGFRQIVLKTWNDPNETLLLPSTRSPWGFTELIRYYRGQIEQGTSPFAEPRFVVAYDPEVLLGDELYVQFLALPQHKAQEVDYLAQIRLEDAQGQEVTTLTQRVNVPDERHDGFAELRLDTTPWAGKYSVLSPVVTVYKVDGNTGTRALQLPARRLPPMRLRYNKLHFYTSYVVSLNRIAEDVTLDLQAQGGTRAATGTETTFHTGDFAPLSCTVTGKSKLRRLMLAEDRRSDGAFQSDDTTEAIGQGKIRGFLRLRSDASLLNVASSGAEKGNFRFEESKRPQQAEITLSDGTILTRYSYHWQSPKMMQTINQPQTTTALLPSSPPLRDFGIVDAIGKPVFRISASPDATVRVKLPDYPGQTFTATLKDLATRAAIFSIQKPDGDRTPLRTLRLELALDSCEPNFDMPLPESGSYRRDVPLNECEQPMRVFHTWALTADNRIAFSRPVCLVRQPRSTEHCVMANVETPVKADFIRTLGTFDDFVNSTTSVSNNFFTADDLRTTSVPAREIPYFLLNLDEGMGLQLNDSGNAPQLGRGWISGAHQWIPGWRGQALRLDGGRISLRSKSFPHGAYTLSLRLQRQTQAAPADAGNSQTVISDGDNWLGFQTQAVHVQLLPDGRVQARRSVRDSEGMVVSSRPLAEGWNHVAVVYDLRTLKLYVNGEPAGEAALPNPVYQRTHSTPLIGFDRTAAAGEKPTSFTGALDQIELIGTALPAETIRQINAQGQWLAR